MSDELAKTIGANMRTIRVVRGMSQRGLARAAGVSSPAVSGWEDGTAAIGAAHLLAVADVLRVSVTRLLGRDVGEAFWDGYEAGWAACRVRMNSATATGIDVAVAAETGATT